MAQLESEVFAESIERRGLGAVVDAGDETRRHTAVAKLRRAEIHARALAKGPKQFAVIHVDMLSQSRSGGGAPRASRSARS